MQSETKHNYSIYTDNSFK